MTPDRENEIERICHAALECDGSARAAFLAEACAGDAALERAVESLLTQESAAAGFMSTPAATLMIEAMGDNTSFIGRHLGPYVIQSRLGAGGMGEVYRAHDTKLGRDVAIKILPRIFTRDPDRLARFEREARLLASLNHPNIGAIYGLEDVDGVPSLVLELVDGETLAERLTHGPLSIPDALNIAGQIAAALEAAHERGIVHRDLKPANIVLQDLAVKVLDFGLAKAVGGDLSGPDLSKSPTITAGDSEEGVILGTASYMSPGQARGRPVDKRADVWAFGCVLFEMLTGRLAFPGDTLSDTIASILQGEPDWHALPETTPAGIRRLLKRCLEKDPTRRLRDIGDARIEIDDVVSGPSDDRADPSQNPPRPPPGRRRWSIAIVISLVALAGVAMLAWSLWSRAATSPRSVRTIGSPRDFVDAFSNLAITPDGTRLVYTGNEGTQIFLRPLDQLEPTVIFTSSAPLNWLFLSPNGQSVGFFEGGRIKKMAIDGGPVTLVAQGNSGPYGATWLPDDSIIFAHSELATGLLRVPAGGGEVKVLTHPDPARGELDHILPEALPGGRAVLYTITAITGGLDAAQIAVLDLATGKSTVLLRGGAHARYVSSGHLIYTVGRTLRAVPFDLDRLQTGTPVQVLPRLSTAAGGAGYLGVSADGTLAYVDAPVAGGPRPVTMVWVDRQGGEVPLGAPPGPYFYPRLSLDGKRVAVTSSGTPGTDDIFIWDLGSKRLNQLTIDPGVPIIDFFPVWMPDNRHVVFFSTREGGGIFRQPADGTGPAERISNATAAGWLPSSVTPDGAWVLFSVGGGDLMKLSLDGTRHVEKVIQTEANERGGIVSPNGRWLAYESNKSERFEIYVRPFPMVDTGQEFKISAAGGMRPLWAQSGRGLFYVAPDGALMAVRVDTQQAGWSAVGDAVKVVVGPYLTRGGRNYDVSVDGQRFLMLKLPPFDPAIAPQIVVVQSWFEELKRLAPAK